MASRSPRALTAATKEARRCLLQVNHRCTFPLWPGHRSLRSSRTRREVSRTHSPRPSLARNPLRPSYIRHGWARGPVGIEARASPKAGMGQGLRSANISLARFITGPPSRHNGGNSTHGHPENLSQGERSPRHRTSWTGNRAILGGGTNASTTSVLTWRLKLPQHGRQETKGMPRAHRNRPDQLSRSIPNDKCPPTLNKHPGSWIGLTHRQGLGVERIP